MKTRVLGLLAATAITTAAISAASAADVPMRSAPPAPFLAPVPVFTWTGFYAGVSAGYGWSDTDITTSGNAANTRANVAALARPPSLSTEQDGFIGGAQVGYNLQFGMFVAGIEADISYTDLSSDVTYASPVTFGAALAGTRSTFSQDLDYLGTVRARVGVAFDRVLVYATGGFAFGGVDYNADFFNSAGVLQFNGNHSDTQVGYTVGGGVEYALTNNLTFKAEYLYYDLGDKNVVVSAIPGVGLNSYTSNFETEGHIARAGVNFKFNTF
jgi:outer membrane immunogenic protein